MARNAAEASALIREAAGQGASFVATPEMTNILEPDRPRLRSLARPEREDASVAAFSVLAQELGLWLSIGSLALQGPGEKLVNRSLLFTPDGGIAARYDKIHLFDVDLPTGESLRESHAYDGGAEAVLVETPLGAIGLTICYDMRFPHLYRALAKAGERLRALGQINVHPAAEADEAKALAGGEVLALVDELHDAPRHKAGDLHHADALAVGALQREGLALANPVRQKMRLQ